MRTDGFGPRPPQDDPAGRGQGPRPVGASLDRLARRLGVADAGSLGALFRDWPEMVGPALAAHTTPASLRDGVLTVSVDDPAWATEVRFLADELVAKVATLAGPSAVSRIDVRVAPRRR